MKILKKPICSNFRNFISTQIVQFIRAAKTIITPSSYLNKPSERTEVMKIINSMLIFTDYAQYPNQVTLH